MAKSFRSWSHACVFLALMVAVAEPLSATEEIVDPAARIAELRREIARHDELYFKQSAPEISDAEYDALKLELRTLEATYPEIDDISSPAGFDDRSGRFPTANHRVPMGSLDKVFDDAGLRAFCERVAADLGEPQPAYSVEPKYDGIAIALTYERGRLVRAVTRGNGVEGDDITANILTIDELPHELAGTPSEPVPDLVELRGEVYFSFEAFARLNREREAAGEPLFAHPRNAAAGTARLTDVAVVAERGLSIVVFGLGACEPVSARPESQSGLLKRLEAWHVPVPDGRRVFGTDAVRAAVNELGERRPGMAYPTDGVVVKVDAFASCDRLGEAPQGPRWAVACKFAGPRATTRVRAITIQVGRSGVLTPVAEFDPVRIAGCTVARASLHNRDVLARKDVRIGDLVVVERAGEVVPEIVAVDHAMRSAESRAYVFPEHCPVCGSAVQIAENGVIVRCPDADCPAQVRRRLEHFASVAAMNIEGLGPVLIGVLVSSGNVRTPADLYRLDRDVLSEIPECGSAGAGALLAALEQSRRVEPWRAIYGLGIPRVGETTARDLALVYPSLEALAGFSADDFAPGAPAALLGLGRATEEALALWFADERHRELVRALAGLGVGARPDSGAVALSAGVIGKTFALTGRLKGFDRDEAISRIRAAGGRVVASVSRRTDYVVAGEDPGAKLDRARELGVAVIDEAELLRLLESR